MILPQTQTMLRVLSRGDLEGDQDRSRDRGRRDGGRLRSHTNVSIVATYGQVRAIPSFGGNDIVPMLRDKSPKLDEWLALRRKEAGITPAPSSVPRNSLWRKKRRSEPQKYTCRQCGERINTMSCTGHIRWGGRIYCPNMPKHTRADLSREVGRPEETRECAT